MRSIITNFIGLSAETVDSYVVWSLLSVYLILVLASLHSVLTSHWKALSKCIWIILIFSLPFAGMALYCVLCLWFADYSMLKQYGIVKSSRNKKTKMAS